MVAETFATSSAAVSEPRAACGPVVGFVGPSRFFIIVYTQDNRNLCFDNLQFDIFDAMVFSACLSCTTH